MNCPFLASSQEDGGAFPEGFNALLDLLEAIVGPSEIPERCADLRERFRALAGARDAVVALLQGDDDAAPPLTLPALRAIAAWGLFGGGTLRPAARFVAAGIPLESSAKIQVYWRNLVRAASAAIPGTMQARRRKNHGLPRPPFPSVKEGGLPGLAADRCRRVFSTR